MDLVVRLAPSCGAQKEDHQRDCAQQGESADPKDRVAQPNQPVREPQQRADAVVGLQVGAEIAVEADAGALAVFDVHAVGRAADLLVFPCIQCEDVIF